MGELIMFPGVKKEKENMQKSEPVKEVDFSSIEERTAINILSRDRYDFVLNLKRNNLSLKHTDAYKKAYDLMAGSSRVDIATKMNEASEVEIKMKPAYYIAAFNILCDTF